MGPRSVPIYITENGFAGDQEGNRPLEEIVNDEDRQEYFRGYLEAMAKAVKEDGIDIAGYFGWSLLE
jgi:beta-glucosidase